MRLIPTSITQKMVDPANPTGGLTLEALVARQKALRDASPVAPAQIASPWQGAAFMANSFVNSLQQKQAMDQETAGRQALAQAMSGVDYTTGANPQQIAEISKYDPDLGQRMVADAIGAARAKATQQAGWAHDEQVTANNRAYQESQPQTELGKLNADLKNGVIDQATYNAKIASLQPDSYRPMTTDDYKTWGIALNDQGQPNQPYRFNIKQNKPEAVGGTMGGQLQTIPAEVAAKLGLADEFNRNLPTIKNVITSGGLSGWMDQGQAKMIGRGDSGEALRHWRSGSEALVRMLTGAGMSVQEAQRQVAQYEPAYNDDDNTLLSKLNGLTANVNAAAKAIQEGRKPVMEPLEDTGAPVAGGTQVDNVTDIPEPAVLDLRNDPSTAAQFDEIFGAGMAAKILGGQR